MIFYIILIFLDFLVLKNSYINLYTTDLGRLLTTGNIIFNQHFIPQTNLFSFTNSGFPFINHHWLTGFLFYLFFLPASFLSLTFFIRIIELTTVFLFFKLATNISNKQLAFISTIVTLPLITARTSFRPETFSYFFVACYIFLLEKFKQNKINAKLLFLLIFIFQALWVNFHIYFFLGPIIISIYLLESLLVNKDSEEKIG